MDTLDKDILINRILQTLVKNNIMPTDVLILKLTDSLYSVKAKTQAINNYFDIDDFTFSVNGKEEYSKDTNTLYNVGRKNKSIRCVWTSNGNIKLRVPKYDPSFDVNEFNVTFKIKEQNESALSFKKRMYETFEARINVNMFFESIEDFPRRDRSMYRYAKRKHDETHAIRRGSGEPYFTHPESVAKIAIAYGGTDTEIKAALAHDTVEDTGATLDDIKEKFGDDVADIVYELTNDRWKIGRFGKETYISMKLISISKPALFVKLCDILHNCSDKPREDQAERMKKNIEFLKERRKDLDDRDYELIDSIESQLNEVLR